MTPSPAMNAELMTLLEIQDLRGKLRELQSGSDVERIETEHFDLDVDKAVAQLEEKIEQLENELAPRMRKRYERVKGSLERVVVPVIGGICYGCFVSIATSIAGIVDPNERLRSCEHCGRFIYVLP